MNQLPLVSIVTPSYNSGAFLRKTIESVLSQDYPNIEYLVIDGGSTDETMAILEEYKGRLEFTSGHDNGPADALNRGFARAKGALFAWINADDEYLPGAVGTAVRHLQAHPEFDVVYGEGVWIDEEGSELGRYPTSSPYRERMLEEDCGICQPTAFFRREAFLAVGGVPLEYGLCFDYAFWIRLSRRYQFLAVAEIMARSRMHSVNITLARRGEVMKQNMLLLRSEFGFVPVKWVYGYLSFLRDGRDQYFEPLRDSVLIYLSSLPVGVFYNYRHFWRYLAEWFSNVRFATIARAFSRRERCPAPKVDGGK